MRARFLTTDYFSAQSATEILRDFHPLSLPAPHLPPSDPHHGTKISCFDLLRIQSEIDSLPIEGALAQFLSDVVPRPRVAGEACSSDASPQHQCSLSEIELSERCDGSNEEGNEGNRGSFRSEAADDEFSDKVADFIHGEKALENCLGGRSSAYVTEVPERSNVQEFQFEVVEVEFPLSEYLSSCETEEPGIHFEVPNIKVPMEFVDTELGITFSYPYKIAMSICAVEDIPAKFNDDHDCSFVKDGTSSPRGLSKHTMKLPHYEVTEIGLELDGSLSTEEAFNCLLSRIELRQGDPNHNLVINGNEFLVSTDMDLLEHFAGYAPSKNIFEYKPISFDTILEMDPIHLNDNMLLEKNSAIYPVTSDGDCSHLPCSVQLLEVQTFDYPSVCFSQMLGSLQTSQELDIPEMFKEDMDSSSTFHESIISSELTLVDDTFKSLPAPVIRDDKASKLPNMIIGDILHGLKPHPLSACDGIYLDWHPLLEGTCNREICSTYKSMLEEVSGQRIDSELQSIGEDIVAIDFDFLDDSPERLKMLQYEEVPIEPNEVAPKARDPSAKLATEMHEDEILKTDSKEHMVKVNPEKASFLFESMSQSNNLNFFLDVRRGIAKRNGNKSRNRDASRVVSPVVFLEEPATTCAPKACIKQWDIEVHQVGLSDHILFLIDHIQKSYLDILENDTDLRKTILSGNDLELLSLPKQKLLELITEKGAWQISGYNDENVKAYVALYAIKQLACLLCFFGVHAAHLYVNNLMRSLDYLTVRLRLIESLIENAYWKAEKRLIESHPSLSTIEGILMSNASQDGNKTLIVAERVFWLPLNLKLTSLKIKIHEVKRTLADQLNTFDHSEFTNTLLDALLHSDCLLASPEHVSASFPFDKFSNIVEYGDPFTSSRISSISPNLDVLPHLHFVTVKMEINSQLKALCEGFDLSQDRKFAMEGAPQSTSSMQGSLDNQHLLQILNFVPIEEKSSCESSESANQVDTSHDNESAASLPYSTRSKDMDSSAPSVPDVVVIVNTQSLEKKMLISRRSSYQKILATEKGGVQVVEREINLPLDLIFSAAVCLVWYEARNIGDSTAATGEPSSINMFMENIATNILMSLSFAFSGCILIFEGESSFLAAIMESSDALYAAAASLDMNLQLFCSYMPESTDEIILSCIRNATRLNKGLYPAMPESETLGESFLTRFPSIHPLSAHAILSSGGKLVEFLEWSPERRIQAIGKYHIPDESISLFSSLCKYGEMGESKSVMTDCSSIDSEVSSRKLHSHRKRQKYATSSHTIDLTLDDSLYDEPLDGSNDGTREMPLAPQREREKYSMSSHTLGTAVRDSLYVEPLKGSNNGIREMAQASQRKRQKYSMSSYAHGITLHDSLSVEPLNGPNDGIREMPQVSQSYQSSKFFNVQDILKKAKSRRVSLKDEVLCRNQGVNTSMTSGLDKNGMAGCDNLNGELMDEVLDHNTAFLDGKFPPIPGTTSFLGRLESRREPVVRSSLPPSRLAFDTYSRTFPTSAEINHDTDKWASSQDQNQTFKDKMFRKTAIGSNRDDSFVQGHEEYLKKNFLQEGTRNVLGISSQEKPSLFYSTNPYSNAIKSSRKRDSQWAIEYFQRGEEKSRMHEQALPCNTCLSCPGSLKKQDISKSKSPSVIDRYRYQGGSQPNKTAKQKWKKGVSVQPNSNIEKRKDSSFNSPSWTPVDKRARQNLSFRRTGNEKQSKLVWRSRNSPCMDGSLTKRYRDEG